MRDTDYKSLRREFLGVGLTGAMVGLAGCSNVIGSDDEEPNIDTAGFNFSYDEVARQVEIEFIGGAAIDAGDVQIQYTGGNEVLWAELGSTAAGVDEDIESGAVATLGPEILNWETPIEAGDTIRIIYVGKETPTTIERYTPSSKTDTETDTETEESEVLEQSLPDPESYIGSGTRSNYTRAIGTVEINTSAGELFLEGPGNNEITAIGGYLAADDLTETDSWGQDVENDTKLIGTNATFRGDRLSFDADSFRGIALRAVRGVNLVIDGETVAENVSTVRYDSSRGVFEQQEV